MLSAAAAGIAASVAIVVAAVLAVLLNYLCAKRLKARYDALLRSHNPNLHLRDKFAQGAGMACSRVLPAAEGPALTVRTCMSTIPYVNCICGMPAAGVGLSAEASPNPHTRSVLDAQGGSDAGIFQPLRLANAQQGPAEAATAEGACSEDEQHSDVEAGLHLTGSPPAACLGEAAPWGQQLAGFGHKGAAVPEVLILSASASPEPRPSRQTPSIAARSDSDPPPAAAEAAAEAPAAAAQAVQPHRRPPQPHMLADVSGLLLEAWQVVDAADGVSANATRCSRLAAVAAALMPLLEALQREWEEQQ